MIRHRAPMVLTMVRGSMACFIVAGLMAGAVGVPPVARAGPWTEPVVLAGRLGATLLLDRYPVVAVNSRGQSLVAWNADPEHDRRVLVATGTRSGRFGPAVLLSRTGVVRAAAIAGDGTAIVLWQDDGTSIRAAVRPPGGHFGSAQRLAGTLKGVFSVPSVAADRSGNVLVAWTRFVRVGSQHVSQVQLVSRPADGSFGAIQTLGTGDGVSCAFNARDDAVVSWTDVVKTGGTFPVAVSRTSVAQVATRPAGGTLGAPATLSATPTFGVRAAIADQGTVAAVWERANGPESDPYGAIQTSTQAVGGAFETPVDAPVDNARRAFNPSIAYGSHGEHVALWQEKTHSTQLPSAAPLFWATRTPGAAFGPRQTLTAADATDVRLAPTGDGRALVMWSDTRLRMELYRSAAGFVPMSAPPAHSARLTTRGLAVAGNYAVFAWKTADRRLIVSTRGL